MKKIDIDLDKLSNETLSSIAYESDDVDVLYFLYDIGVERHCSDILIGILKNGRFETKETVRLIEEYAKNIYEITDLDNVLNNKEDNKSFYNIRKDKLEETYSEVRYDEKLKNYLAVNPYTSADTLIDMLIWGEISPILNASLPNDVLNSYMVSSSSLPLIQNNPEIIEKLVSTLSYKLSDETLIYLSKVPFKEEISDVNIMASQAMERRVAFRAGIQKSKKW